MLHLFFDFFLSWQLMLRYFGLRVGLSLGLGHFSVVEFWSMQGVSDALLGHAALRLCWPYLRLTLSNIQAMLGCCCVPLSPCCADVEPTCLGTAFVVCHVCHAVVQCGFVRLGGVWACVWNVVFARYFSGVAMAFEWYFWCMGGLLLVGVLVVVAWLVVSSHNMGQ